MDHEREIMNELRSKYGTLENLQKEYENLWKAYRCRKISWETFYCTGNDLAQAIDFWKMYGYL